MGIFNTENTADMSAFAAFFGEKKFPVRDFGKNEVISNELPDSDTAGIILSGSAYAAGVNENGRRAIMDIFTCGDYVGQYMFPIQSANSYFYISTFSGCRIAFIQISRLCRMTEDAAAHELIKHIALGAQNRVYTHMYILQQRTLADKLMLMFEYLAEKNGSREFTLPMSYTNLADYLAADRSAMTREIKKLNDEGRIISDKLNIRIQ